MSLSPCEEQVGFRRVEESLSYACDSEGKMKMPVIVPFRVLDWACMLKPRHFSTVCHTGLEGGKILAEQMFGKSAQLSSCKCSLSQGRPQEKQILNGKG